MRPNIKILLVIFTLSTITGCGNKTILDTTYTYDRAIIQLADGTVVDTKIKSWTDYEGEQIQVIAEDGTVYLTSSFRCDLIKSIK